MENNQVFIYFPGGYSPEVGNLDLLVTIEENVYSATCFTPENIQLLMLKENEHHFWSNDMLIVKDLAIPTLLQAIAETITEGYFTQICRFVGNKDDIFEGVEVSEDEWYKVEVTNG